ncbi:MAG: porin [Gallionellaceae bacterium]|nr:porin [Gallionellaceae bacterium]
MKKSLIALAVAGAFAAPAFAASSNVDVYGTLRYSLDHVNSDAVNANKWTVNDQTSRFGIKGSEDLGGGLKAVWQIEQQISSATGPLDNAVGGAGDTAFGGAGLRNTFVGVAGGFGTVIIGRHDTPYKLGGSADVFADTSADSQKNGTGIIGRNGFDNRAAGTVAYVSPEWSGFHFAVATVPGEQTGTVNANGLNDAYSMVGVYANGPLKATLGHEVFKKDLAAGGTNDAKATKFNIAYKIGDIGLGYTYERSNDGFTAAQKTDKAHLASVTYGMGPITLAAQYGQFNNEQAYTGAAGGILGKTAAGSDDDLKRWTLGAIYNLSKRTNVYAAYNSDNYTTAKDVKVFTMGVNTSF